MVACLEQEPQECVYVKNDAQSNAGAFCKPQLKFRCEGVGETGCMGGNGSATWASSCRLASMRPHLCLV